MFKKFTISDKLFFISSILSLIYSEVLFFLGDKEHAAFVGLWVPSILVFGIYLKLIKNQKDE